VEQIVNELLARFRWVDGHADIWRWFTPGCLNRVAAAVADPYRGDAVTHVVGIEARGFILGAAVAMELEAGFVAIRKPGGLLPGDTVCATTPPDYRQRAGQLRMQGDALGPGDRVLLVDDWLETGSQA
jgi:adenine phosphoribosyltransferase